MEYTGEVIRRPLADLRERRYTEQGVQVGIIASSPCSLYS